MTTERIRIDLNNQSPIFKCSKPGIPVMSATPEQVLFDMGYGVYSGIMLSGVTSAFVAVSGGYTVTVPYGQTLAAPPKMLISFAEVTVSGAGYRTTCPSGWSVVAVPGLSSALVNLYYLGGALPSNMSYVIFFV